jgi:hypothetical protein
MDVLTVRDYPVGLALSNSDQWIFMDFPSTSRIVMDHMTPEAIPLHAQNGTNAAAQAAPIP